MLYYFIISIDPKPGAECYYQSAEYYADRVANRHYSVERLYENFTSLQQFKRISHDWQINAKSPIALLTVSYNDEHNEYRATDLYIINSMAPSNEHHFNPPVVLALADLNLEHEEIERVQPGF